MTAITSTSTKNQILDAYNEILIKLKEQEQNNTFLKKELADKEKIQRQVKTEVESKDFLSTLEQLKTVFINQADDLKSKLIAEAEKLDRLQKSTEIENQELEELYQIKAEAQSLEALINTQKKIKDEFEEKHLEDKKALEQEIENKKAEWKREEEAYIYKIKIERRNEEDAYLNKKLKLESELSELKVNFEKQVAVREDALSQKENEFVELKSKVEKFDSILQKAISDKEKEISEKLKREYEYQKQLDNKDLEVKVKLFEHEISVIKQKNEEQKAIIEQLMEKSTKATDQVKDIAIRAIESASNTKFVVEKTKEDNKS